MDDMQAETLAAKAERLGPSLGPDEHGFEDLRALGVLWLLNRVVFHPRGFALGLVYPEGVTPDMIQRHDVEPVGWRLAPALPFGPWQYPGTEQEMFESVERFFGLHRPPEGVAWSAGATLEDVAPAKPAREPRVETDEGIRALGFCGTKARFGSAPGGDALWSRPCTNDPGHEGEHDFFSADGAQRLQEEIVRTAQAQEPPPFVPDHYAF